MKYYDQIYEVAADNYGLFTSAEAKSLGIPHIELVKLAHRGRLTRLGHGVYRLVQYIPTNFDGYAAAVAIVGPEAYLYGESVLALHNLISTNPASIYIATPARVRKNLPAYIRVLSQHPIEKTVLYEGIPSQLVANAIRACRQKIMDERLLAAIREAERIGIITKIVKDDLIREFTPNDETT